MNYVKFSLVKANPILKIFFKTFCFKNSYINTVMSEQKVRNERVSNLEAMNEGSLVKLTNVVICWVGWK